MSKNNRSKTACAWYYYIYFSAAIQAFEHTFELAIKMLRRQLEEIESSPVIEQMSYRDLIRTGAEKGFIDLPKDWFLFREKRNLTSHGLHKPSFPRNYLEGS